MIPGNSVILYDNKQGQWLGFREPVEVFEVHDQAVLLDTLNEIENCVDNKNLYAAGFLSYEAAGGINPALVTQVPTGFPLCWFGLYKKPEIIDPPAQARHGPVPQWEPSITVEHYQQTIGRIRQHILDGETYQVNFSYRFRATLVEDSWSVFSGMIAAQGYGYGAFVELADWNICSASPELFFILDGRQLSCRPMKGTVSRGTTLSQDRQNRDWLGNSFKDRAENLMIVDMVRNDLGQVADTGTVRADSLFNIEKYPTLWQMTSNLHCQTKYGLTRIMQSLYPAASITGAPKRRTMEIIRDIECSPRNIYTGTIGYYSPGNRAQFNVAIRTVLINKQNQIAEYGVGGGIVWDSDHAGEFRETRYKAGILNFRQKEFSLLESVLWEAGRGYWLLAAHLSRLRDSAEYFSRSYDEATLLRQLETLAGNLDGETFKIRILVDRHGNIKTGAEPVNLKLNPLRIGVAKQPVNTSNIFLYHKTTYREVYEDALAQTPGFDDVLLWNENGEITETGTANVIVEKQGELFTSPVSSGLLAGTCRAELLRQGMIKERPIRIDELDTCTGVYLINSVRGRWKVDLTQ